jgi:hypothetical protein|tara:strand:+ start:158 stop:337 length:180 start_codon:yes stop_codon:yes gene_type:complete
VNDFLKGNYSIDVEISDDEKEKKDEFRKNALNSIGGSMVFVERKKMVWNGDEEDAEIPK